MVAILGSTFDGSYEPVAEIAAALDELAAGGGPDVPVHVDGASGGDGRAVPRPRPGWDFRLPRVASINTSGHKYGLVYPGVGWVLWRDTDDLPEELVFNVNYLGGNMPTFALNFSRPGAEVVAQYYNFFRLGCEGYRASSRRAATSRRHLSPDDRRRSAAFRLDPTARSCRCSRSGSSPRSATTPSSTCRQRCGNGAGRSPPTLSRTTGRISGLRIVVRNGFSRDLADLFLEDLRRATEFLEGLEGELPTDPSRAESFKH